jgi:hypothetical protein
MGLKLGLTHEGKNIIKSIWEQGAEENVWI